MILEDILFMYTIYIHPSSASAYPGQGHVESRVYPWNTSVQGDHKHTFTPRGNLSYPNPPACMFFGGRRKPEETHTDVGGTCKNSTKIVIQAQDETGEPGALRQQHYSLCHHAIILCFISAK